ncbi:MAG: hypothetical protein N2749_02485 [Clostridia bacterium]|nr:hypothetical protein [Clostridia bacterium]
MLGKKTEEQIYKCINTYLGSDLGKSEPISFETPIKLIGLPQKKTENSI